MKKRIISVLLCVIMLLGMTPVMSSANSYYYQTALDLDSSWLMVHDGKGHHRMIENGTYITNFDGEAKSFDLKKLDYLLELDEDFIAVQGAVVYMKGDWHSITGGVDSENLGYLIGNYTARKSMYFYLNVYGDTTVDNMSMKVWDPSRYHNFDEHTFSIILNDNANLIIKDYLETCSYVNNTRFPAQITGQGTVTACGCALNYVHNKSRLKIAGDVSLRINASYSFKNGSNPMLFPDNIDVETTGDVIIGKGNRNKCYLIKDIKSLTGRISTASSIRLVSDSKEKVCKGINTTEMDEQIKSLNAKKWNISEGKSYGDDYSLEMRPNEPASFYLNDKPVSSSSVDIVKGEKTTIKVVGELSENTQKLLNKGRIFWPKEGDKDAFLCKIRRGGTHELISEGTLSVSEDNSKFIITASFTPPEGDLKTDNYYISYKVLLFNGNSHLSRSWSSTLIMKAKPGDPKITGSVEYTGKNKGGGTITANYKGSVPSDKLTYTWMVQKTRVRNLAGKRTFNRYWAEVAKSNDGSFTIPEDYEADLMRECKRIRVKVTAEGYRETVYGDTLIVGRNETVSELEDITITNENTSVEAGDELALEILRTPVNNKDKISWKSSDTSIATVDSDGKVTGIKVGEVTITAECGTIESDVKVTVVGENHVHNYTEFSQFDMIQHVSKCGSCGTESLEDHVFTSKSGVRVCSKCGYEDRSQEQCSDSSYTPEYPSESTDEIIGEIEDTEDTGFDDVYASDYYTYAVKWAVDNDITKGKGERKFAPNDVCSRAQVVTFLWRAAGSPEPGASSVSFSDVKEGSFYEKAVLWAVEKGITNGSGEGTFSPDADCSRSQILTFLWRAQNSPAVSGTNTFSDVADSAYYADAVLWAVGNDITKGTSANKFSPNAKCTRGQVVTFMYRAMSGN